ncbi:MAG TPA: chemotaxis protein CheW [Terriglobales bacterium]|nr:chemotaxis protein CheW [Terriglobales bacterium]
MRIARKESRRARGRRSEAVILFAVGSATFAIAAQAVDEIRSTQGLCPLQLPAGHSHLAKVRYTLERGSRTFYVVDMARHFRVIETAPNRILLLRGVPVALLVAGVDRMTEIVSVRALPRAFRGEERRWYRGLALVGDQVVPVVNPEAFLSRAEQMVLGAALEESPLELVFT